MIQATGKAYDDTEAFTGKSGRSHGDRRSVLAFLVGAVLGGVWGYERMAGWLFPSGPLETSALEWLVRFLGTMVCATAAAFVAGTALTLVTRVALFGLTSNSRLHTPRQG